MSNFYEVLMPFGVHKGSQVIVLPSDYLIWIVRTFKGGFKAKSAGKPDLIKIPDSVFMAARYALQERGYNTKGLIPVKR